MTDRIFDSLDKTIDFQKKPLLKAFRSVLKMSPAEVIEKIITSGLRGRGGAGFPTGLKWKYTAATNDFPKYVICNADEGEPGTFKDRYIMEKNPFLCIEGLMIAAYAIGASKAFIYVRGEYVKSIRQLKKAILVLKQHKLLGENILKTKYSLDIELKYGAGSYLCGEELTLIESLEGKRGNPRIKPPFPAEKGAFQKPTLVNNVETLSNVPFIIDKGVDWFRSLGTEKSPGTKLFCLSGDVRKPGLYEAELGISLYELVYKHGGGLRNGKKLKAVLCGGAAGTFILPGNINVKMDYDSLKEKGFTLGSGAVIVFDEDKKIDKIVYSILKFFSHESCGKCVPCRVGTKQLLKDFKILASGGEGGLGLLNKVVDDAVFMSKTSLCPLGQSPVIPLRSSVELLKNDLRLS